MYGFDYLKNFLQEEGFEINEENLYFTFNYQGRNYITRKEESPFLQIRFDAYFGGIDRSHLLEVCNSINKKLFAVKLVVSNQDGIEFIYEFIPTDYTSSKYYETIFIVLDNALRDVSKILNE